MRWRLVLLTLLTLSLLTAYERSLNRLPGADQAAYPGSAAFAGWTRAEDGCGDKRAEILRASSTRPVTYDREGSGCTVDTGRWLDPYTGQTFTDDDDLDIDHVIPKKWAWEHGARSWPPALRSRFANDAQNLLAVDASANRSKSDKGPEEWMPPLTSYSCDYITLFVTLVSKYDLQLTQGEGRTYNRLHQESCGDSAPLG